MIMSVPLAKVWVRDMVKRGVQLQVGKSEDPNGDGRAFKVRVGVHSKCKSKGVFMPRVRAAGSHRT